MAKIVAFRDTDEDKTLVREIMEYQKAHGLSSFISAVRKLCKDALAIEKNLVNYSSRVLDEPIKNYYPDGKRGPEEWYGYYKGNISLNYAIRKSANTIPVRLLRSWVQILLTTS